MIDGRKITKDASDKINRTLRGFHNAGRFRKALIAAHLKNGLDLNRLVNFSDLEKAHDVYGIYLKVDLKTGELNGFVPKCGFN